MNRNTEKPFTREVPLDALAAELAVAAYSVALPTSASGAWIDLELELWRALVEKLKAIDLSVLPASPATVSSLAVA
jgi:hypothetical protein